MNKQQQPKVEWGFYAMTPRIVRTQYKDLTHAEKWFYTCLKDLCGDDGMCFRTLRKLQEETDISLGSLTPMINHLNEAGLIHAEKKKRPKSTREVWHITIVDIWQANFKQCSKNEHSQEEDSQCSKFEQSTGGNVQNLNEVAKELSSECSNFATRRRYTKNTGTIEEDKDTYTDVPSEIGTPSPSPLSVLLETWRQGNETEQKEILQVLIDAGIVPGGTHDNHSHSSEMIETSLQDGNSTSLLQCPLLPVAQAENASVLQEVNNSTPSAKNGSPVAISQASDEIRIAPPTTKKRASKKTLDLVPTPPPTKPLEDAPWTVEKCLAWGDYTRKCVFAPSNHPQSKYYKSVEAAKKIIGQGIQENIFLSVYLNWMKGVNLNLEVLPEGAIRSETWPNYSVDLWVFIEHYEDEARKYKKAKLVQSTLQAEKEESERKAALMAMAVETGQPVVRELTPMEKRNRELRAKYGKRA